MQPSPWTPTANGTPTQVLLVEDDRRLAELVSDYLHEHGFAVQHVARGDLAGAACLQHAPELVVLDLMLPGLGGIDVCRQIPQFLRRADPDADRLRRRHRAGAGPGIGRR